MHLEHYVKINRIVLFKYLEAFVALQAIFKMTFKTICKEDKSNGGRHNLLMFPSLAASLPWMFCLAHNVGYIKDPNNGEQRRTIFESLFCIIAAAIRCQMEKIPFF